MATPFPGHLRAGDLGHATAIWRLLELYDAFDPFLADALAARNLCEEAEHSEPVGGASGPSYEILRAFARRWNLDWIPELRDSGLWQLRGRLQRVGNPVGRMTYGIFTPGNIFFSAWEPELPFVEWEHRRWAWQLGTGESLAECRQRIVRDLGLHNQRALPAVVRDQLTALPEQARAAGWILADRRHSLDRHLEWLFLRLCPQPDQSWSPARIAKDEHERYGVQLDERVVRSRTDELATSLRIDLPRLRPGRAGKARDAN